jgi:glycosyltransferase involved in cell wall biosynthesis
MTRSPLADPTDADATRLRNVAAMNSTTGQLSLSVVIPCRNEERVLAGQLSALAAQEYDGPWEVIVVDNGSSDHTRSVAESFENRLPSLRVAVAERRGRQRACNVGASLATGDALLFVDADDEVAPGYLSAMAAALRLHQFVAARLDLDSLNAEWIRRSRPPVQVDSLPNRHLPTAVGGSLGIRRGVFEALGGFEEDWDYAEDVEFCWRAQLAGVTLHLVHDAVLQYRYRTRARDLYRQARGYGRGRVLLDRRYSVPAVAMRTKIGGLLGHLWSVARRVPRLRDPVTRAWLSYEVGYLVGFLQGHFLGRRSAA